MTIYAELEHFVQAHPECGKLTWWAGDLTSHLGCALVDPDRTRVEETPLGTGTYGAGLNFQK